MPADPMDRVTPEMAKAAAREQAGQMGEPLLDELWTDADTSEWQHIIGAALDAAASSPDALRDRERLDWLENRANGHPIEVDSFTGLRVEDGEAPGAHDAVFLTTYPAKEGMPLECERVGCHMNTNRIVQNEAVRIGQGRSLRQAIDAAMQSDAARRAANTPLEK